MVLIVLLLGVCLSLILGRFVLHGTAARIDEPSNGAQSGLQTDVSDAPLLTDHDHVYAYDPARSDLVALTGKEYKIQDIGYDGYFPTAPFLILEKERTLYVLDAEKREIRSTGIMLDEEDAVGVVEYIRISQDRSRAHFQISMYAKPFKEDELGLGGPESIRTREYIYDMATGAASTSDMVARAEAAIDSAAYIWFRWWDDERDTLYGHPSGHGIESYMPVYAYDIDTGEVSTLDHLDHLPYFSPTFSQYLTVDGESKRLKLYRLGATSAEKEIDISMIDGFQSVAWSPDESEVAIGTDKAIYVVSLVTGEVRMRYSDTRVGSSYMYWSRYSLTYSSSGRYVYFIDYDNESSPPNLTTGNIYRLMAIDTVSDNLLTLHESSKFLSLLSGGYRLPASRE